MRKAATLLLGPMMGPLPAAALMLPLCGAGRQAVMGNSLQALPKASYSSLVTKIWKVNVNNASAGTPAASTVILR